MTKSKGFWSKIMSRKEVFEKPAEYTPVGGMTKGLTVREEPAGINLLRAVNDEADNVVKSIERELIMMEKRKVQLQQERDAHIELLSVAQKHVKIMAGGEK